MTIGSRVIPPPHYVSAIEVDYAGRAIWKAQLTFSVSMDPSFRFYFAPEKGGTMTVKMTDTKDNHWSFSYDL